MKDKQEFIEAMDLQQDDNGHWFVVGVVAGDVKGSVWGNVGNVLGDVKGVVEGKINGHQWKFKKSFGVPDQDRGDIRGEDPDAYAEWNFHPAQWRVRHGLREKNERLRDFLWRIDSVLFWTLTRLVFLAILCAIFMP